MKQLALLAALIAIACGGIASIAFAQTTPFSSQPFFANGMFGCNQTGAYGMSVGTMAAQGSSVPVSDAAVILNTGYLVYEQCVLRNVVDREREAATAAYTNQIIQTVKTGRNGNPQFSQSLPTELNQTANTIVNNFQSSGYFNALNPAMQQGVTTALYRDYYQNANQPQSALACSYGGNLQTVWSGNPDQSVFSALDAVQNPNCDPMFAYLNAQNQLGSAIASAQQNQLTELNWGHGYYPVVDANGNVITPGYTVANILQQAIDSPLNQLQMANDIGQMIGQTFAGLTSQIINPQGGGLAGSDQYLQAIQQDENSRLSGVIINTALQNISPVLQREEQMWNLQNGMAQVLSQAISQLRSGESQCFSSVVQSVCGGSTPTVGKNGQLACNNAAGNTLQIATSTEFSQPVIDSQITPLALTLANNASTTQQNVQALTALAASVQNTTNQSAQQNALHQLDLMEAQNSLPQPQDVITAQQQSQTLVTNLTNLVKNTFNTWQGIDSSGNASIGWGGSVSNPAGWCNVNSQTTLQSWTKEWQVATSTTG